MRTTARQIVTRSLGIGAALMLLTGTLAAQEVGRIDGRLVGAQGAAMGGASVVLSELGRVTTTDADGRYTFARVPAGSYTLSFTLGSRSFEEGVEVAAGATVEPVTTVDWVPSFAETITVQAASRRVEPAVEAPAAVTVLSEGEIARQSTHGQLPRLFAFTAGVEMTQSGLYDINLNARGFNGFANRRVLTLIDGRDPSLPVFSGSQEWSAVSYPLDEFSSMELVRGPGAALYGAGAYNGVLNLTTKDPQASQGGMARLTAGELDSVRLDLRHAAEVGEGWFVKALGSYQESDSFSRSRVTGVEYEGLPTEVSPLPLDRIRIGSGGLRLDRDFGTGRLLTLEAGTSQIEGTTFVTGGGRFQRTDVERPWGRVQLSSPHWIVHGSYTGRISDDEFLLSSGQGTYYDSSRSRIEAQGHLDFAQGRGQLIGGLSASRLEADSANPEGAQTLLADAVTSHHEALFTQVDLAFTDRLKGVLSLRADESDLHDRQLSPRIALVYQPVDLHTVRLSFGQAFQSPTLVELYAEAAIAPSLDLSAVEDSLAPLLAGVPLGFEAVPILAVGNPGLEVEEIDSFEVGYNGIFGQHVFLTANYYRNQLTNFTSGFLPLVGTSLGRLSDEIAPYQPPAGLSDVAAQAVLGTLAAVLPPSFFESFSNRDDGSPIIALFSLGNFGEVTTEGVELALHVSLDHWRFNLNYSSFHFDIREEAPENPLSPNAPENQVSLRLGYVADRFDAALQYRWVDGFPWSSGFFIGFVPTYEVTDLNVNYLLNDRFKVGFFVTNLLDDEHYEVFGGDLIGRRALAYLSLSW